MKLNPIFVYFTLHYYRANKDTVLFCHQQADSLYLFIHLFLNAFIKDNYASIFFLHLNGVSGRLSPLLCSDPSDHSCLPPHFLGPVWCRASKSPTPMSPYCPPAALPRRWTLPWTRTPSLSPSTPASWARSTALRWVGSNPHMPHTWPSVSTVSVNQLWQLPSMFSVSGEQSQGWVWMQDNVFCFCLFVFFLEPRSLHSD